MKAEAYERRETSLWHSEELAGRKQTLNVFPKNNYNADFIRLNIYRPTETDDANRNPTFVITVTIPTLFV